MSLKRVAAFVAAALVAGLVLGNMGAVFAATPQSQAPATPNSACGTGLGLKLGAQMKQSGATLADIVAKLTGLSVEDVRAKRTAGQSFAQISKAKGVSADKVVAEALAKRQVLLDAAVKAGKVTQAQADQAKAQMKTRLTERVNATATSGACDGQGGGGRGGMGGRGMGRGMGMGGGGCGGNCGQAPAGAPQASPSVNL